jgi:hypothetical protein
MLSHQKYPLKFHSSTSIAYRGKCDNEPIPENTLSAVIATYKLGVLWVECDVKTSTQTHKEAYLHCCLRMKKSTINRCAVDNVIAYR